MHLALSLSYRAKTADRLTDKSNKILGKSRIFVGK